MKKSKNIETETFLNAMEKSLPEVFARHSLTNLSGGLINSRTIANRNSRGDGPPFVRYGKAIALEKVSFLQWLKDDLQKASLKQKAMK